MISLIREGNWVALQNLALVLVCWKLFRHGLRKRCIGGCTYDFQANLDSIITWISYLVWTGIFLWGGWQVLEEYNYADGFVHMLVGAATVVLIRRGVVRGTRPKEPYEDLAFWLVQKP